MSLPDNGSHDEVKLTIRERLIFHVRGPHCRMLMLMLVVLAALASCTVTAYLVRKQLVYFFTP